MGKTREKSRGKDKNGLGLKIFLACLVLIIVGLAVTIIVIGNKSKEENPEMSLEEYYNQYYDEVDRIYDDNPDNIMKVVDYFTEKVNANAGNDAKMNEIISSEIGWFERKNIEDEGALLEGLIRLDYSNLINVEAYNFYTKIVDLATKLNRNDVVEKYTPLLNEVREELLVELESARQILEKELETIKQEGAPEEYIESAQDNYDSLVKEIEKIRRN